MTWDPGQYLAYEDLRLRPALELLGRVPRTDGRRVVDLGCGAGNVTPYLAERWPDAQVVGVDDSAEMLERARADHPDLDATWVQADAATWEPDGPVDVLYSNALLHWLDDHERLVPRMYGLLADGGTLAFQVPDNYREPSHREAYAVARDGRWADRLVPLLREQPVLPAASYARLLTDAGAAHVDVWSTTYLQPMTGEDPVAEWTKGSLLRPLLAALDDDGAAAFEHDYRVRLRAAYPRDETGTTWFEFTRLFVVASRGRG